MECMFAQPGQNASLPFAHYVPRRGGVRLVNGGRPGTPASDTVIAIMSSITAPGGVENHISASCSTGNCTFPDGDPRTPEDDSDAGTDITTHSTVAMCSKCTDVTSLVNRNESRRDRVLYRLPDGNNVSRAIQGSSPNCDTARILPTANFTWLGDSLTPEMSLVSRWAYINVTFFATVGEKSYYAKDPKTDKVVAAACTLYPCLRTYIASVAGDQLIERPVRSQPMRGFIGDNLNELAKSISFHNGASNSYLDYVTVKSPCRVEGKIYDIAQNMSSYPNTLDVLLANATQETGSRSVTNSYQSIKAPKRCIYRHASVFAIAINDILKNQVLNGHCEYYKTLDCMLKSSQGTLANLGADSVLKQLYSDGYVDYANITRWFDGFADAMTNRFRFEYGAADSNQTKRLQFQDPDLPLGVVDGVAWQSTICVAMRWEWLLLPAGLTLVTTVLAIWTMAMNWKHRHIRPVWKDSILPLIFYGDLIQSGDPGALLNAHHPDVDEDQAGSRQYLGNGVDTDHMSDNTDEKDGLLEASEMQSIGAKRPVTFKWPNSTETDDANGDAESSAPLQKEKVWLRLRKPQETSGDSLLGAEEGTSRLSDIEMTTQQR
jgi:hypothetical protein